MKSYKTNYFQTAVPKIVNILLEFRDKHVFIPKSQMSESDVTKSAALILPYFLQ